MIKEILAITTKKHKYPKCLSVANQLGMLPSGIALAYFAQGPEFEPQQRVKEKGFKGQGIAQAQLSSMRPQVLFLVTEKQKQKGQ